jgi:hypothetical protein
MNNKAQFNNPIVMFALIIIGLIIVVPLTLKIINSVKTPMHEVYGNMSSEAGNIAQKNTDYVFGVASGVWDKVSIFFFIFALLVLIISAFLIDTSVFWVIVYILVSFFVILFTPNIVASLDVLYTGTTFGIEGGQLTFMSWLRDHYGEVLVGVMVLTGIIIYGKVFLFGRDKQQ